MGKVILFILALIVIGSMVSGTSSFDSYREKAKEKQAAKDIPVIKDFKWTNSGVTMIVDFQFANESKKTWKDMKVVCEGSANSGTKIDKNERVVYEILKPGEKKTMKHFNMGFLASQVERVGCKVVDAVEI